MSQVRISKQYRSRFSDEKVSDYDDDESREQALLALERISASCSPLTMSGSAFGTLPTMASGGGGSLDLMELQPGVSPALICQTVSNVLRLELGNDDMMLPLLHSLIDGLTDEILQSGKGSSLILCSLLETTSGQGKGSKSQKTALRHL